MSMPCDTGLCNPAKCTDLDCCAAGAVPSLKPIEECSQEEQLAYNRGMILLNPLFNMPDRHLRTNNTMINRYLESRKLRVPGTIYINVFRQLSSWADRETVKQLKKDLNIE
jgi:hypothetical protein